MPIYEYKCKKCGNVYEKFIRNSDKGNPPCPKCGSSHVEKIFSTFSSSSTQGGATTSGPSCGG